MDNIKQSLDQRLKKYRKIASVKEEKHIEKAARKDMACVSLLTGNLGVIKRYVDFYKKHEIPVFLHIDKIGGLSSDSAGIEFIANYIKPAGVISTRNSLLKIAKKNKLLTIQRLFLVDSAAVKKGLKEVELFRPDYLELMPALMPELIEFIKKESKMSIITGGLVSSREHISQALDAGAIAVSGSSPDLWKVDVTFEEGSDFV